MNKTQDTVVGIDDMALYVPSLYLPIETLAKERGISFEKLNKGLGLEKIAIPDVHEDAATMAANVVAELIERNNIKPQDIGRIYLGTESALDGAKPTATYVLEMLRRKYKSTYGLDCFQNCDVVDLTFACVGGVDALHNTLDWVSRDKDRIGIVVTSDFAKYELASTGEYTQGAGAIAMLVKQNPRLLSIADHIGVATQGVHDFFKPKRIFEKRKLIDEVLKLAGIDHLNAEEILSRLSDSLEVNGILDDNDDHLIMHKDTPVFDGPYSNQTYQNRIREAYFDFRRKQEAKGLLSENEPLLNRWSRMIFHLPYAAHGRRIASEIFMIDQKMQNEWESFAGKNDLIEPQATDFENSVDFEKAYGNFLRLITKTEAYRSFSKDKLSKAEATSSEVGNMYACSIFMALMGTLEADDLDDVNLSGEKFACFSYGSGSKSKVFEAEIQPMWKSVVKHFQIRQKFEARTQIDYPTYESLHRLQRKESVLPASGEFQLDKIGQEPFREGARYYSWAVAKVMTN